MGNARARLAEAGQHQAPPDATVFRAGGVDYYLYMGATEMRALQREWGLSTGDGDTAEERGRKLALFQSRLDSYGLLEDDLTLLRHGLTRWHQESQPERPGRPRAFTNDDALKILEDLEPERGDEHKSPWLRISALKVRFFKDMFGVRDNGQAADGAADPNAPGGEASTQSSS